MSESAAGGSGAQQRATGGNQPTRGPRRWGAAASAGAVGGAIAGLIASYGTGRLGFVAFVVFMFTIMGIRGGSRKLLATVLFGAVAALVVVVQKGGEIDAAKSQIGLFKAALDHYALDCGTYPFDEQGLAALVSKPSDLNENTSWKGPYLTGEVPKDPWGNEYQYSYPPIRGSGDAPDIWSWGPDGEDSTADDICSWE